MDISQKKYWLEYGNNIISELLKKIENVDIVDKKTDENEYSIEVYVGGGTAMGLTSLMRSSLFASKRKNSLRDTLVDPWVTVLENQVINGTIEEVGDAFINPTKQVALEWEQSKVVATILPHSKENPLTYIGLRWGLLKSLAKPIIKDQDFCYLEIMKPIEDPIAGRRGWVHCCYSIEHPMFPDFSECDLARGRMGYTGAVYYETKRPGILDVTYHHQIYAHSYPSILVIKSLRSRIRNASRLLNHYLRVCRTNRQSKIKNAEVALQLQAEKRCGSCYTKLAIWSSKTCSTCLGYICKDCYTIVQLDSSVRMVDKDNTCYPCAKKIFNDIKTARFGISNSSQRQRRRSSRSSRVQQINLNVDKTDTPPQRPTELERKNSDLLVLLDDPSLVISDTTKSKTNQPPHSEPIKSTKFISSRMLAPRTGKRRPPPPPPPPPRKLNIIETA